MRKVMTVAAVLAAFSLGGCTAIPVVGAAAALGVQVYCMGVHDTGKAYLRDRLTGGVQVFACEDHAREGGR
ncbi:MAG: hypothetical protein VR70_05340 [Rhodospirillaceae bacterium BRH_c57]|nr:MAG: hypothetical protein VR70_05340 [Rhodospirillaceae bacterium BRH_c57]